MYSSPSWLDGRLELDSPTESVVRRFAQGHFVQRLWQLSAAGPSAPTSASAARPVRHSVDQLGFNTRLHWVISADKDLYVVWNRNWRQS